MGKVKEQSVAYSAKKKPSTQRLLSKPKQVMLKMLKNLKDDVTYEDIMYELYVLEKIQRAEQQLDEGQYYTHEEVKKKLKKWLK